MNDAIRHADHVLTLLAAGAVIVVLIMVAIVAGTFRR